MIKFFKSTALEVAMIVVGYIAITIVQILGRMTMKFGRAVFSR